MQDGRMRWIGLTLVLFMCGCGRSRVDRVVLSGDVRFKGAPVEVGKIQFLPEEGSKAPMTITDFKDGHYDTSITEGVAIGKYRVEITGHKAADYANYRPGPFAKPPNQLLPEKYNVKSELTIDVQGGERQKKHDFDLQP